MTRRSKILVALGIVLFLVALGIFLFDWNMLRGPVERYVSQKTGRPFAIHGDLDVKLSKLPLIEMHNVVLGNAPWGSQPRMAEVERVAFRIDLLELFHRRIVLPNIELNEPTILLETDAEGKGNWQFNQAQGDSAAGPAIGELQINKGRVGYRASDSQTAINLALSSEPAMAGKGKSAIRFTGEGFLRTEPFSLEGRGASLLSLTQGGTSYRMDVRARAGNTEASFEGSFVPFKLESIDGQLKLKGQDLAQWYPIIPVALPWTPPYSISGHLVRDGQKWSLQKFTGKVGDSDLSGDFALDRTAKRPAVSANLVSRRLNYKDLGGFVGAAPGEESTRKTHEQERHEAKQAASGRVLSSKPYNLERLRTGDADVHFRGERVVAGDWPLDTLSTHLKLVQGEIKLAPLDFGIAGGHIVANLMLDARKDVIRSSGDASVRNLELKRIFPELKANQGSAGKIGGRAKLATIGNSVAEMAASANGELSLIMAGGQVSTLALLLSNIDLANAATLLLRGDQSAPVRCVVVSASAHDGSLVPNYFIADTSEVNISGEGSIDLRNERYKLQLIPDSKRMSFLALRGPIDIGGTFKNPHVGPATGPLVARAGAAVALGLVNPLLALVPLFDPGNASDSNCGALIKRAKQSISEKRVPKPARTTNPKTHR